MRSCKVWEWEDFMFISRPFFRHKRLFPVLAALHGLILAGSCFALAGVSDASFFVFGSSFRLPLFSVEVMVFLFFALAPLAVLVSYAGVVPGLADCKGAFKAVALGAGPLVLAAFWWRSLPAHEVWLTLLQGVCFVLACAAAQKVLYAPDRDGELPGQVLPPVSRAFSICLLAAVAGLSLLKTEYDLFQARIEDGAATEEVAMGSQAGWDQVSAFWDLIRPARAKLDGATFTRVPDGPLPSETVAGLFLDMWCANLSKCETTQIPFSDVNEGKLKYTEWRDLQRQQIAAFGRPRLTERDLRRAHLDGASLILVSAGTYFLDRPKRVTDFSGASLRNAHLMGGHFVHARFDRADMRGADFRQANLGAAKLRFSSLDDADLSRAFLSDSKVQGASLRRVRIDDTRITSMRADLADFSEARMTGVTIFGSYMRGVQFQKAELEDVSINGGQLSEGNFRQVTWRDSYIAEAHLKQADFSGAHLFDISLLQDDFTAARFDGAHLEEVGFFLSTLAETRWLQARLSDVEFKATRLAGTAEAPLSFYGTRISNVRFPGSALRYADFSGTKNLDFRNSFGDGSVILPDGVARPCQWASAGEVLSDRDYWARWRGWLESSPLKDNRTFWNGRAHRERQGVAPEGFELVEPIAPPAGCNWSGPAEGE